MIGLYIFTRFVLNRVGASCALRLVKIPFNILDEWRKSEGADIGSGAIGQKSRFVGKHGDGFVRVDALCRRDAALSVESARAISGDY